MEELEKRIEELEDRLDELEGKEHRRKVINIIKICIKAFIIGLIIFGIYRAYTYVNNNYIKPLNEIIESTKNIKDSVDISSIKDWFKSFE